MKIGIDARLYSQAGIGRYIRNILLALVKIDQNNNYVVYLGEEDISNFKFSILNFQKRKIQVKSANYPWYSVSEQICFPIRLYKDKLDLLFVPHFNAPVLYFKKTVVTVHDMIMHKEIPSLEVSTRPAPLFNFRRFVYKIVFFFSILKAKKIFVPTRYVGELLLNYAHFNVASKIIVTPEAVDPVFVNINDKLSFDLTRVGVNKPYLLYVGSAYPHKNLKDLVIAFKNVLPNFEEKVQLIILGKRDIFLGRLREFSKSLGLEESVIFPSFVEGMEKVNDSVLKSFYQNANSYITASLDEGFNLTPLEAIANGIPCAISDIPAHREIYQGAALFFNPLSIKEIEEALVKIVQDQKLRASLTKDGTILLSKYSWGKTARTTLNGFLSF